MKANNFYPLLGWLRATTAGAPVPGLLLTGPTGSGKTTLAKALMGQFALGAFLYDMSANDGDIGFEFVNGVNESGVKTGCLIFDNCNWSPQLSRFLISRFLNPLKYRSHITDEIVTVPEKPMIFTSSDTSAIPDDLQRRLLVVELESHLGKRYLSEEDAIAEIRAQFAVAGFDKTSDKTSDIRGMPLKYSGALDCMTAARQYADEAEKAAGFSTDGTVALVKSNLALGASLHGLTLALISGHDCSATEPPGSDSLRRAIEKFRDGGA